jgi:hypothetical protein
VPLAHCCSGIAATAAISNDAVPTSIAPTSSDVPNIVPLVQAHEGTGADMPARRITGRKLHQIRPLESPEFGGA